jgi:signal transduction histidine kinase
MSQVTRDTVLDSIHQAVKNAVVEFTEAHAESQQTYTHTLTHDLRTPISVAKMNAHLALKCSGIPTSVTDCIKRNVISLNRLDSMIQNLLDVSRIRAGESLSLQYQPCDLERLIREVVDEMTIVHGPRFVVKTNGPYEGNWGQDALRRAVENLIDNAAKYGAEESPITVSAKDSGVAVEICVHNVGSFIPENEIPRMFEKFRRSQSSQDETQPGWGLGLTLVQAVVEDHQGKIRVHSSEDAGTTFVLELPHGGAPHN